MITVVVSQTDIFEVIELYLGNILEIASSLMMLMMTLGGETA